MKNFWKIFGIGAGAAAVASIVTSTVCRNAKKIREAFPEKKKSRKKFK